jgi:hypothetical protein
MSKQALILTKGTYLWELTTAVLLRTTWRDEQVMTTAMLALTVKNGCTPVRKPLMCC